MEKELFYNTPSVDSSRVIYTPSSFARSSLFHLQETGTLKALFPHSSKRNGFNSYLFFTVLSGEGSLQYDGKTYELKKGDCVFIDCKKTYSHSTGCSDPSGLWELKWVHFYGPNMNSVYQKYQERGGKPVFSPTSCERYVLVLDELYETASSTDYVRDMRIHGKLSELLILLMEDSWNPGAGAKASRSKVDFQEIKEYLDNHYREKITLDQLSSLFYINKYYLAQTFKERYGSSVVDYLIHKRITEGKRLLRFTDMTIEEISEACGMTPHYFARQFRLLEGMPPGEFKRVWAGKEKQ